VNGLASGELKEGGDIGMIAAVSARWKGDLAGTTVAEGDVNIGVWGWEGRLGEQFVAARFLATSSNKAIGRGCFRACAVKDLPPADTCHKNRDITSILKYALIEKLCDHGIILTCCQGMLRWGKTKIFFQDKHVLR
jgi:hypothetical protein